MTISSVSFRSATLVCVVALFVTLTTCSQEATTYPLTVGKVTVSVEIARTPDERAVGLMYRENVAEGTGMLFVFEEPQLLNFWMKNTFVPLSIAYADKNGRIVEIHDMEPKSQAPVRSSRPALYALEVPQGYFDREGIRPGDVIDISEVGR